MHHMLFLHVGTFQSFVNICSLYHLKLHALMHVGLFQNVLSTLFSACVLLSRSPCILLRYYFVLNLIYLNAFSIIQLSALYFLFLFVSLISEKVWKRANNPSRSNSGLNVYSRRLKIFFECNVRIFIAIIHVVITIKHDHTIAIQLCPTIIYDLAKNLAQVLLPLKFGIPRKIVIGDLDRLHSNYVPVQI